MKTGRPLANIHMALNLTVAGIVSHHSALNDGELLKIPHFNQGVHPSGLGQLPSLKALWFQFVAESDPPARYVLAASGSRVIVPLYSFFLPLLIDAITLG